MRLTLRTLLAYLDDILEPEDAEDISRRVQESEVASALMHRIRDVMRRLRLEAPLVEETGKDLDPNTVAEYLDHILPDERVPDFERICLESDMHLAEVASCHQILALVLGEPAEVDPASREHMYALPQVASELQAMEVRAAQEPVLEESILVGVEPPPPPRRPRPVVPDYLREQRPRRHPFPWIVAAVLLIGVIVVGWLAADYFSRYGGQPSPQVAQEEPASVPVAEPDDSQTTPPTLTLPVQPTLDQQTPPFTEPGQPVAPGEVGQAGPPGDVPPTAVEPTGPGGALPPAPDLPGQVRQAAPGQVQPAVPGQIEPAAPGPVDQTVPGPAQPAATPGPAAQPAQPGQPGQAASADTRPIQSLLPPEPIPPAHGPPKPQPQQPPAGPPAADQAAPGQDAPPAVAPVEVGRFVSDASENQVLLQRDNQTRAWSRVPTQGELVSDHDLLALPASRPLIALTAGVTIQLRGGAQIGIRAADDKDIPQVTLKFGRMVINTPAPGKPDARLLLTLGGQSGALVFVDPESRASIEAIRPFVPGADPENAPADPVVEVHALAGRSIWEAGDRTTRIELKTSSRLTLGPSGTSAAEPVDRFPRWIVSGSTDSLDRLAFRTIEEGIPVDRPVTLGLREKLEHRKKEVKWLATRCLGYVGDFGPLVAALDNPEQKSVWVDYLDQLHEALARGPETAANVRAALQRAYGTDGADVYRMLWGYTPDQLLAGQDADLVKALGSDLLAARVVSFWNLNTLTGLSLYYRPEDPASKRQQRIREWDKRLESGELQRRAAARANRGGERAAPEASPPSEEPTPPAAAPSPAATLP